MLEKLNPFIRFAKIMTLSEGARETSIAYDNRLFVCLEGSFRISVDEEFSLSEGDAVFIPQYTPYRLFDLNARLIPFNFDLTSDNSRYEESHKTHLYSEWNGDRLYTDEALPYFDKAKKFHAADSKNMFLRSAETFELGEPLCKELASAYLKCAILRMLKEPTPPKHPAVLEFMRIVSERYSCDITAVGIAREIGYHEGYLNRLVKAQLGMCVSEYIMRYRIGEAKKLLDLGYGVGEAATACGFSELSYFSGCFKRIVGMTPREYKQYPSLL